MPRPMTPNCPDDEPTRARMLLVIDTVADFLHELRRVEASRLDDVDLRHGPTIGDMYEGLSHDLLERALPPGLGLRVVRGFITDVVGLPTLVMPETGGEPSADFARIGHIEGMHLVGREYRYRFVPTPGVLPIPTDQVVAVAASLSALPTGVLENPLGGKGTRLVRGAAPAPDTASGAEGVHTPDDFTYRVRPRGCGDAVRCWVRPGLYDARGGSCGSGHARPACRRHLGERPHHGRHHQFDLACTRGDLGPIRQERKRVLRDRHCSHARARRHPITRAPADVPFDLQPLRYVHYLPNEQGLEALKASVTLGWATWQPDTS